MKKTVLITGVSRGIGKALTHQLLEEGYAVFGTSRNGKIDIEHPYFKAIMLDLSNSFSIEQTHKEIFDQMNSIDILINNAGIGPDLDTQTPERESFDLTFSVNVTGTVFFTERLIELISHNGVLLNISSKMGAFANCELTDAVAYRMSKSAMNMYTKKSLAIA